MTRFLIPRAPVTRALRELLEGAVGIPFGIAAAPRVPSTESASTLVAATAPYGILYPLWRNLSGSLGAPDGMAELVYQASVLAERGDSLDVYMDSVFDVFLGRNADRSWKHPLEVPGAWVMDRVAKDEAGIDPADAKVGVFEGVARFGLHLTPSG